MKEYWQLIRRVYIDLFYDSVYGQIQPVNIIKLNVSIKANTGNYVFAVSFY